MKITGKINKIYFTRDGWSSFSIKDSKTGFIEKCAGSTFGDLAAGMTVEVTGKEEMTKYGMQITIDSFRVPLPSGEEGLRSYLSSGLIKGIGPSLADKIVAKFGANTLDVIKNSPDRLLEIPGISTKKAESIINGTAEFTAYAEIFELAGGEITKLQAGKILKEFGTSAADTLRDNPYILYERIDGFGFLLTDKIAKSCGMDPHSKSRLKAAITYVLIQIGELNGHCYVTIDNMQSEALELLCPMPSELAKIRGLKKKVIAMLDEDTLTLKEITDKADLQFDLAEMFIDWAKDRKQYIEDLADALLSCEEDGTVIITDGHVASEKLYVAETIVADRIKERLCSKPIDIKREDVEEKIKEYEERVGFTLAPEQKEAAIGAVKNHIYAITGGPGTGKTSSIESIIYAYKALTGGDVILMAPTGRAAARIKEKLTDKDVLSATIHKMTGAGRMPAMIDPTPRTMIIVDECSMININLAVVLLNYAVDAACLVLVGDKDQLPSIGAGNFFRDVLLSNAVPKTTLKIGFRNAGLIAQNSAAVNSGNTHIDAGEDFKINLSEREEIADKVISDYLDAIKDGYEPKDLCLLSLQRTRGMVAVEILNRRIQDAYNPLTESNHPLENTDLRIGDRVMQIHNNYKQEYVLPDGTTGKGVFNGDTGTITDMDPESDTMTIRFDDGRLCEYDRIGFSDVVLAYAVTVHKSQGSEYKKIWLTITTDAYTLLSRSIVYTGITRASEQVNLYAEKKALSMAIRTETNSKRATRLVGLLAG